MRETVNSRKMQISCSFSQNKNDVKDDFKINNGCLASVRLGELKEKQCLQRGKTTTLVILSVRLIYLQEILSPQ